MTGLGQLAVDAGGSRTRALVAASGSAPTRFELPSINRSSSGAAADAALLDLFTRARAVFGAAPAVGWLATASVDPNQVDEERRRVRRLAGQAGVAANLVLSNDVVPLLWGVPELSGRGVVLVCGTGAGFLGADGAGRLARAGGCEYLGSDEGGAADLGRRGLRAAVRATDGRGRATALVRALAGWAGCPAPELARRMAAEPFPKQRLAELAPLVCQAWRGGDRVAGDIVRAGVAELVLGVRAVRDRLGLAGGFAVAVTGGVVEGSPEFHAELAGRLTTELDAGKVSLITDTTATVLAALRRLSGPNGRPALPAGLLGEHAWPIET